jgi:superfamily II DNA or RNA helicase
MSLEAIRKKNCGSRNSKNNPAYTKEELIQIVIKKTNMNKTTAKSKTLAELCVLAGITTQPIVAIKNVKPNLQQGNYEPQTINCNKYTLNQIKFLADKYKLSKEGTKERICVRIENYLYKLNKPININKPIVQENSQCMMPLNKNIILREHQIRVVKHMLNHRGLLAIHNTGTGKTLTAVSAMNCILQKYPKINVVFISPLSLLANFQKEIIKFGFSIDSDIIKDRVKFFSYAAFSSAYKDDKNMQICKNSFLIIDEAHNLRNPVEKGKGIVADTLINCSTKAFKVLLLTATPMKNRPSDIVNLITIIDGIPDYEAPTSKFFNQHIYSDDENFRKYFACKVSINLAVKDNNYPKRIDYVQNFIMDNNYYNNYLDIQNEEENKHGKFSTSSLFYTGLRQASFSLEGLNSPKVQWTFNKLKNEAAAGRKSIAYSSWKKSGLNYISELLNYNKIPYGIITGNITPYDREFYKNQFNKGKIKILLLSKAGGEGLDLVACNTVILTEPNWNASDDEQIIGRAIRFQSHFNLPESQRYVEVWRLFMKKPQHLKNDDKMKLSVDDILYKMSYYHKEPIIQEVLKKLEKVSIENINCNCYDASKNIMRCSIKPSPPQLADPNTEKYLKDFDPNIDYDFNKSRSRSRSKLTSKSKYYE